MIFNFLRFFCFFLLILLSFGFFNIWLLRTNPRIVFFLFRWLLNSQYFPVKLGKHRHVLGGLTHFPPFKQGGEHIAENIKNHYDLFQLFFKGKNFTSNYSYQCCNYISPFLQFLPEYPIWQSQVFGAIHRPPFRQPPLHLASIWINIIK